VDWYAAIRELHEEKKRLDRLIAALEAVEKGASSESASSLPRRGRKTMSAEERKQVSERMKRYWAGRRDGITLVPESGVDSGVSS
jgi:hypothetical protein